MWMIVIGVDVHKHSSTAVAVDEVGRPLDELSEADSEELLAWAGRLPGERLWALEDCRHVTRNLERALLEPWTPAWTTWLVEQYLAPFFPPDVTTMGTG
jgi:hypothetical protein